MGERGTESSHLLIQTVAQLGDAALDLVELAALLLAVALYNVHGVVRCGRYGDEIMKQLCCSRFFCVRCVWEMKTR